MVYAKERVGIKFELLPLNLIRGNAFMKMIIKFSISV